MNRKMSLVSCYIIALLLGGITTYIIKSYHPKKSKKKVVPDYVILGSKEEKNNFVEYSKGLFLSDSTVLKQRNGILATPKVVSEVTLAILNDKYPYDLVKFNYPYYIYKGIFEWHIEGTSQYNIEEGYMYLGGGLSLELQRSNGMVHRVDCTK